MCVYARACIHVCVWIAIPFSRGSSWPRDQTQVSCIAGRFFTIWGSPYTHTHTHVAYILEESMSIHFSTLAWKITWTEKPGELQFIGSHRVRPDWSNLACMHSYSIYIYTHTHIYTYLWNNYFSVYQKPTKHYKQLYFNKINFKNLYTSDNCTICEDTKNHCYIF